MSDNGDVLGQHFSDDFHILFFLNFATSLLSTLKPCTTESIEWSCSTGHQMTSKNRTVPDYIICNFGWKNFFQILRKYTKIISVPDHCCFLKYFERIISVIIVIFPFLLWKERVFCLEFHAASFDWKHENPSFRRQFLSKPKFCRDHGHLCCFLLNSSELPFSSILIKIFCPFIL